MKITDQMVVPGRTPDDDAVLRTCEQEQAKTWHVPQRVMVLSASGARRMTLWTCEGHPLPDTITDTPED